MINNEKADSGFVTNEWRDFLDNLNHLERSIIEYREQQPTAFKWIIISMYMTLQSAFVACLKGTDFHNVTRNKARNERLNYRFSLRSNWDAGKIEVNHQKRLVEMSTQSLQNHRKDQFEAINRELPEPLTQDEFAKIFSDCWMLMDFGTLYGWTKSQSRMRQYIFSKPLPSNPQHDEAIQDLINLRNQFIHFIPKYWAIDERHIETVILPCLQILTLLINSGNMQSDNPKEAIEKTKKLIKLLKP